MYKGIWTCSQATDRYDTATANNIVSSEHVSHFLSYVILIGLQYTVGIHGLAIEIGKLSRSSARTCKKSEGLNFVVLLAKHKTTLLDSGSLVTLWSTSQKPWSPGWLTDWQTQVHMEKHRSLASTLHPNAPVSSPPKPSINFEKAVNSQHWLHGIKPSQVSFPQEQGRWLQFLHLLLYKNCWT